MVVSIVILGLYFLKWLDKKEEGKKNKEDGKFICPVGKVAAEIIFLHEEKEYSLPYPLHNFRGKYIIKCPKMCLDWEEDGGCFSCTIDVPGVCMAAPQNMAKRSPNVAQWYQHQWCCYLPNIQKDKKHSYNRVVNLSRYKKKENKDE